MWFLVSYLDEYYQRQWISNDGYVRPRKESACRFYADNEREAVDKATSKLAFSGAMGILRIRKDWLEAEEAE